MDLALALEVEVEEEVGIQKHQRLQLRAARFITSPSVVVLRPSLATAA